MCRMIFLGTATELEEIPPNEHDICIERISGEFLPVADKFENPYIYFIGTSRGCSCDFGIYENRNSSSTTDSDIEQFVRKTFAKYKILISLFGNYEKFIAKKVLERKPYLELEKIFYRQTLKLIDIIETHTTENHFTELYCCWAEDYASPLEEKVIRNLNKTDLKKTFEIDEREKIIFVRE